MTADLRLVRVRGRRTAVIGAVRLATLLLCSCAATAQQAGPSNKASSYNSIHEAAAAGATEAVQAFLDRGAGVDARRPKSAETPFLSALNANEMETAVYLLDQGADPRAQDRFGNTALHHAARWGDAALCRRLLGLGLDVDARNNQRKTPLHLASERRRVAAIRILAEAGAALDLQDGTGRAPIDYALQHEDPKPARALIEAGARIGVEDEAAALARSEAAAAKGWKFAVAHALREAERAGADDLRSQLLKQAFERAFANMDRTLIDFLIAQGARLDVDAAGGLSRLHLAAELDGRELVRELAERGLDPRAVVAPAQWSTLHLAATGASPGTAIALLNAGIDVNAEDALGRTPLHVAVWHKNNPVAAMLIRRGADVNVTDRFGNTPLHYAAEQGLAPIVNLLLDQGASPSITNDAGATPFQHAKRSGQNRLPPRLPRDKPVAVELPPHFGQVAQLIQREAAPRTRGAVRHRLETGLRQGFPLLHLAVQERSRAAVSFLLRGNPASVDDRDRYGFQALHAAAETGAPGILTLLIDAGATVNDRNNLPGWTPLHFAAAAGEAVSVQTLLKHGADPGVTDAAGRSPADLAARAKAHDAVSALEKRE